MSDKVLGYCAFPFGVERFLDKVALEFPDLTKEYFEIGVGGGLVLGREAYPLDVVHLEQKLGYLLLRCHLPCVILL